MLTPRTPHGRRENASAWLFEIQIEDGVNTGTFAPEQNRHHTHNDNDE
jgi:hypothetical protein